MFAEEMDNAIYSVSHLLDKIPDQKGYFAHSHNYCEILLFLRGDADYFVEGKQYSLKPYDMILIPRHMPHCLILNSKAPYENYVLHFHDSLLFIKDRKKLFRSPLIFNVESDTELLALFGRLDTAYETYEKEDFHSTAQCLCQEIVTYCCYMERIPAPNIGKGNMMIPNVLQYITSHLEEDLDADRLAREFSVSPSHLQNTFSQEMRTGLKQYIMQKKILAAHNDMSEGLSAGEAAAKYGFREYSTFYRLYRKTFACSPSERKGGQPKKGTVSCRKT